MSTRRKQRGLFSRDIVPPPDMTPAGLIRWLKAHASTSTGLVDQGANIMRAAAQLVLQDANLPVDQTTTDGLDGNAALAAEILGHLRLLAGHRRHGRQDDAIHAAMMATQRWMELRANVLFEAPVREKERRNERTLRAVTNAQIREKLATTRTFAQAADALGITEREIRNRIPRRERDRIRKNRKA